MAKKKTGPVDPTEGARFVLDGRLVTMNNAFRVVERGRIYTNAGVIEAVRDAQAAPPAAYENAPLIRAAGTIFPGLVELHNHLSYNALPLWNVPRAFANRGQWSSHPDKKRLISQPMSVLAGIGGMIEALVRYVETKCLVGGVTTSQGLKLVAKPGIDHFYRGIVRNVEQTDDVALPEAASRIPDVANASQFLNRLRKVKGRLLLHLAEGIGESARRHFLRLQLPSGEWAISPKLVSIHGAGLQGEDFDILAANGSSLVWSPLSNLLLYAGTADVERAREAGVVLSLGSDWSPSGSKNLLSELKVAAAWSDLKGGLFTARELVSMVTINPARMLGWDGALGSIEPGKRADLVIVKGRTGDAYEKLLKANEDDLTLVLINGVPRYGEAEAMQGAVSALFGPAAPALEKRTIGSRASCFNFVQETADPLVHPVSLQEAQDRLTDGLRNLPNLASALSDPLTASSMIGVLGATSDGTLQRWTLALDNEPHAETAPENGTVRPLAPWHEESPPDIFGGASQALNGSIAANLLSMQLDALTVVDDATYFDRLARQINLPESLKSDLPKRHGAPVPTAPIGRTLILPPVADSSDQISLAMPRSLRELTDLPDALTARDRITIVQKLRTTLEEAYVHLPLKRAAHAVDPLQRLRLLEYALTEDSNASGLRGLVFHRELLDIFTELRDLHTQYLLPPPFNELTAILPFLVERAFDGDGANRRSVFLVARIADSLTHPTFVRGVELLYWNGMPIEHAITRNADRQAGSNLAARFARGLAGLTIRPLVRVLPPEEEWVHLTYRALDGSILEIRLPWQMRSSAGTTTFALVPLSAANIKQVSASKRRRRGTSLASLAAFGLDVQMEAVNTARRDLYAPSAPPRKQKKTTKARTARGEEIRSKMPDVLRARTVPTRKGLVGHLRIFTFSVEDADRFIAEIVRLLTLLPKKGLIIDVRNNGGGLIWAAEQLLQLFTDRNIEPERAQFLNSPRMLDLARKNAPSPLAPELDLSQWSESISRAVLTGAVHSDAFPITPPKKANAVGRRYQGPVVLITDALAYSATDIFAAGFRDHEIGPILGVDDNTGAGGANVWSYPLLQRLLGAKENQLGLPGGCDLRIAIRRTLRAGQKVGTPLEDLGIEIDERHYLTRRDVLEDNEDLLEHAAKLLS